jgi:thymidylate synthase
MDGITEEQQNKIIKLIELRKKWNDQTKANYHKRKLAGTLKSNYVKKGQKAIDIEKLDQMVSLREKKANGRPCKVRILTEADIIEQFEQLKLLANERGLQLVC